MIAAEVETAMKNDSPTKLLAIRVKWETAELLYSLAHEHHRNPGAELDVILGDLLAAEIARREQTK